MKKKNKQSNKKKLKQWKKNRIWSHCSNKSCKDYTEMYLLPNSAIAKGSSLANRLCKVCGANLTRAKTENGKPVMPAASEYKSESKSGSVVSSSKAKSKNDENEVLWGIIGFIVLFLVGAAIIGGIKDGFNFVSDKLDDRSSQKERCIDETRNIENEFTAKKLYKACMKR